MFVVFCVILAVAAFLEGDLIFFEPAPFLFKIAMTPVIVVIALMDVFAEAGDVASDGSTGRLVLFIAATIVIVFGGFMLGAWVARGPEFDNSETSSESIAAPGRKSAPLGTTLRPRMHHRSRIVSNRRKPGDRRS